MLDALSDGMAPAVTIIFLLHLVVFVQSRSPTIISVNTSNHLESLLCNYHSELYSNDVIIILNSTVTHEISSGKFCTVNGSHSLTITSDDLAHIVCIPNDTKYYNKYWTRGFAFYGISGSLTLSHLNFSNCGTNLTTLDSNLINYTSSPIHFTQYQVAVLVFTNIGSLYVEDINFNGYNGFAIVAVNLPNASFNYLKVSYSRNHPLALSKSISIGSGVLILFSNKVTLKNHSKYNLSIIESIFERNFAFNQYWKKETCVTSVHHLFKTSYPVVNAAGVTILYTQNDSIPAIVNIFRTKFTSCSGYFAGAMLILYFNSNIHSQTIIDGSLFSKNSLISKCRGAAITNSYIFNNHLNYSHNQIYQALTVTNTTFINNGEPYNETESWGAGAVCLYVAYVNFPFKPKIYFKFRNVSFVTNFAQYHGACMYTTIHPNTDKSKAYFVMESITAHHNPNSKYMYDKIGKVFLPASVFYFININKLIINGSEAYPSTFSQNYGSVFEIIKSTVVLQGMLSFHNNTADQGPAFRLLENSLLYLKDGLRANFTNNTAKSLGGAIYAKSGIFIKSPCTFQLYSNRYKNIIMNFRNNTADIAGNAIYSEKLFDSNCYISKTKAKLSYMYNMIFHVRPTDIVSYGNYLVICDYGQPYETYPGASLKIPISVNDSNHHHTFGILTVSAAEEKNNVLKSIDWHINGNQNTYTTIIKGTSNCTNVSLTIHTTLLSETNKTGVLLFSISNPTKIAEREITLQNCPPGFKLHPSKGACGCSTNFKQFVKKYSNGRKLECDINNVTFTRPYRYLWAGLGKNNSLHYSCFCPPGYCNIHNHHDLLKFKDTGSFLIFSRTWDSKPLCYGSRTGDLCGECISNHSVVFGSTVCLMCNEKEWMFASIIYILAGPLLVFLLYVLKLTLAMGTLNSIIFYAQIMNAGIAGYLKIPCNDCGKVKYFIKTCSAFISWLNLNQGFPLCLYSEMTEIWKAGLSLFFPVYLILIIGFLVILSQFSSKVSNRLSKSSVQVLVTVVHLSFTQLVQAILNVFKPAKVYIESETSFSHKTVWYFNGTTVYASTEHQCLMVITSAVVGFILIPYMVVILFGKCLLKYDRSRKYIRPFFEAIHAPYKANRWYWFAVNQIIVVFMYILDTIHGLRYAPLSLFFQLILFLIVLSYDVSQAYFLPFKNKILNVIHIFLLLNTSIVFYTAIAYFHEYPEKVAIFVSISICPAIIIISLIIVYHVLVVTKKLRKLFLLLQYTKTLFLETFKKKIIARPTRQRRFDANNNDIQDTGDYTQAREPLLEWIST